MLQAESGLSLLQAHRAILRSFHSCDHAAALVSNHRRLHSGIQSLGGIFRDPERIPVFVKQLQGKGPLIIMECLIAFNGLTDS